MSEFIIDEVSVEEAQLLDVIFTLQSWDLAIFEKLSEIEIKEFRMKIGLIIIGKRNKFTISSLFLETLLILTPVTYRFGKVDVGLSLKTKLYKAYLIGALDLLNIFNVEEINARDKNNTEDNSEDSTSCNTGP